MNNKKIRNAVFAALLSIQMIGAADSVPATQSVKLVDVISVGFLAGAVSCFVCMTSRMLDDYLVNNYFSAQNWLNSANSYLSPLGTIQPVKFSMRNPRGQQSLNVENFLYFITQTYAVFKRANPQIASEEEYCRTMITGAAALLKDEQREQFLAAAQHFNSKLFTIDPATVDGSNIDLHAYIQAQSGKFTRWFSPVRTVNQTVAAFAGIGACWGIFHGAAGLYMGLLQGVLLDFGYQLV